MTAEKRIGSREATQRRRRRMEGKGKGKKKIKESKQESRKTGEKDRKIYGGREKGLQR